MNIENEISNWRTFCKSISKKRVLFVTQYFPPDLTAAAFRIGELARFFYNNSNLEILVLTTVPHKTKLSILKQDYVPERNINRIPIKSSEHLLRYMEFVLGALKYYFYFVNRFDWIIVSSPPIFVFEIARLFRGSRSKILLDVRDLWPDTPVANETIREKKFFI